MWCSRLTRRAKWTRFAVHTFIQDFLPKCHAITVIHVRLLRGFANHCLPKKKKYCKSTVSALRTTASRKQSPTLTDPESSSSVVVLSQKPKKATQNSHELHSYSSMVDLFGPVCLWRIRTRFGSFGNCKWGPVLNLCFVLLSSWFLWERGELVRFQLRIGGPRMCRSRFGPSGRVLHCSSKLGMLLLSMFLIYLLVFFFEYISLFEC